MYMGNFDFFSFFFNLQKLMGIIKTKTLMEQRENHGRTLEFMGTQILFTKLDTGIFLISYLFLSYQNKQQYCPCMQTLRNIFNVNLNSPVRTVKKIRNCVKKNLWWDIHVLFDITVNLCPCLQMMPALKNLRTVSIEQFYL